MNKKVGGVQIQIAAAVVTITILSDKNDIIRLH